MTGVAGVGGSTPRVHASVQAAELTLDQAAAQIVAVVDELGLRKR